MEELSTFISDRLTMTWQGRNSVPSSVKGVKWSEGMTLREQLRNSVAFFQPCTKWRSTRCEWCFRTLNYHGNRMYVLLKTSSRKKHVCDHETRLRPYKTFSLNVDVKLDIIKRRAKEIAQWVNVFAVLAQFWSSCPSPYIRQLTTVCHSSSKGTHAFSLRLKVHEYTNKNETHSLF